MGQSSDPCAIGAFTRVRGLTRGTQRPLPCAGFSLIEVVLVVLILAVIAGLAAPMFSGDSATRLRAAAQVLEADLAFAQVESISHGDAPRIVVFDTVNHRYHIATAAAPDTPINHPTGNVPYRVTFGQGAAASLAGVTLGNLAVGGDDRLGFGIYGQLDQVNAATITLASDGNTITLTLDPTTGKATIGAVQ